MKHNSILLNMRKVVEITTGSGKYETILEEAVWNPGKTAAIVCDMWDKHWCRSAAQRVAEIAPRMNEVLLELRRRGVLIIHAPSDTMEFYKDHPGRNLAKSAPTVETSVPMQSWKSLDLHMEGELPIDDSDGGCECEPKCKVGLPWTRQIETLVIMEEDAITESAEALYLMKQRGIENVILMGVHTNMCVLGRPFGIRQMVIQGQNVVLMRDMTDALYNPSMRPNVDHFAGTDLVIGHIEKYWCPTVTSDQLIGGQPFRFKADTRILHT